jgi:hypothetical protein
MGKAAKVEGGSGVKSKTPKGAASTQQRLGEAQKLRMGMGLQVNLPKQSRWWILELISWDIGQHSKLNCPTLLGKELNKQSCN